MHLFPTSMKMTYLIIKLSSQSHAFFTATHTFLVSPSTLHSTSVRSSIPSNTAIGSGIVALTDLDLSFCLNAVVQ